MKTRLLTLGTLALLGSFPSSTAAALVLDKTIVGDAVCAKCELKETETSSHLAEICESPRKTRGFPVRRVWHIAS